MPTGCGRCDRDIERRADRRQTNVCEIALDRRRFDGDRSDALLIDNRLDLIEGWRNVGGAGYWFQSDERFRQDLPRLLG
jgi:hypothetical protein